MDKFISDPHLSHDNIIKFERTQFKTIKEHDDYIKNLITTNLHPNDTLYVLGDVGEMSRDNIQFWKNLKCKTILIRGNHDTQKQKLLQAFDIVSPNHGHFYFYGYVYPPFYLNFSQQN